MTRNLRGRRLLITGTSSGIGKALVEAAVRRGARVASVARSADLIEADAQRLADQGGDVLAIPADVRKPADRRRIFDTITARWGGLDVLLNNAGVGSFCHFDLSTEEVLRDIMETNFFAPIEMIRLALPLLEKGEQPAICNLASMTGRRAMPGWSEYSASKHALVGFTEAMRGEMIRFGIDVVLVLPGLTRSNLKDHLLAHKGRYPLTYDHGMAPEYVAEQTLRAIERNRAETVLGREAQWILFVNRFLPWFVEWRLTRLIRKLWPKDSLAPADAGQRPRPVETADR
jgi:short-subunit dehydrogenase